MRQQLLERGIASELSIDPTPEPGDAWLLINSLDCRMVSAVDGQALSPAVEAKQLWMSLLKAGTPS